MWLLAPICKVFDHKITGLTINGRDSGLTWCDRCGARWWRGRRKRREWL
jgi:hypothetical protein